MPIATIPLTAFTGGEWSPRLHGRVDVAKYTTACETLQNMVIYPHGGITRRMGMEYIGDARTTEVRLIPFEYNREQAYVLEFSQNKIRFFRDGGQITALGVPYEVTTTYTASELKDLAFTQSGDVLYIAHQNHAPAKVQRTGPDTFTLTTITFTSAPTEWVASSYPTAVCFYQNRLCFAGPNQTLWLSNTALYEDFSSVAPKNALTFTLASNQANAIQWITSTKRIFIGTTGGEWTLGSIDGAALTATSVQAQRESNFGSKSGRVQLVGTGVIYVSRDGKKLREMAYSLDDGGYLSPELSLFSEHITRPGIKEFDFAQNPDGILWTVMEDGTFAGFTYLKSQEVQAWHSHVTDGSVKSVCTIEGESGTETWFAVERNGATRIERMAMAFEGDSTNDITCTYLDSFLTYDGVPATNISGLDHLNGKTVSVLADGQWLADKVVSSGHITLEVAASKVVAGLPYEWKVVPLRLEGGSAFGTSQGKRKRIESLVVRVERSLGISHAVKNDSRFEASIPTRSFGENFGEPAELFTGDLTIKLFNEWERHGQFVLKGSSPFPVTILMITAKVMVNE